MQEKKNDKSKIVARVLVICAAALIVLAAATCDDAYGFVHDVASAVAEGRRSAVAAVGRTRL